MSNSVGCVTKKIASRSKRAANAKQKTKRAAPPKPEVPDQRKAKPILRDVDEGVRLIWPYRNEIAAELKQTPRAIGFWVTIPAEKVVLVERVTGYPRQRLRPDLFANMMASA